MMTTGSRTEKIVKDEYGFITEWLRYEMDGLNHLRIDERYDSPGDANSVIDDNDPWRVQRVYYNGPGQLGQIVKATVWDYTGSPTATDYYYGYDILGNVSVISNNSGVEVDQFEQDAFGNEVESSWSGGVGSIITERLTTKQYDADLGLYYFNARWYDGSIGGFSSYDVLNGTTEDTQSHNKYLLAMSNPVLFVDPSGMKPTVCSNILMKRLHMSVLSREYGHWWTELVDCNESYGWWPAYQLGLGETLRGIDGVLNGVPWNPKGSLTHDPHEGEAGDNEFSPVVRGRRTTCDKAATCIRDTAQAYEGKWQWPKGPNCHTFQRMLMRVCDLEKPGGGN